VVSYMLLQSGDVKYQPKSITTDTMTTRKLPTGINVHVFTSLKISFEVQYK